MLKLRTKVASLARSHPDLGSVCRPEIKSQTIDQAARRVEKCLIWQLASRIPWEKKNRSLHLYGLGKDDGGLGRLKDRIPVSRQEQMFFKRTFKDRNIDHLKQEFDSFEMSKYYVVERDASLVLSKVRNDREKCGRKQATTQIEKTKELEEVLTCSRLLLEMKMIRENAAKILEGKLQPQWLWRGEWEEEKKGKKNNSACIVGQIGRKVLCSMLLDLYVKQLVYELINAGEIEQIIREKI
jgi:hypothetical protein